MISRGVAFVGGLPPRRWTDYYSLMCTGFLLRASTHIMSYAPRSCMSEHTYVCGGPRLSMWGQCLHARSKNGFVTPSSRPAFGGRGLTSEVWSASWMVKNGRKSPASGIYGRGLQIWRKRLMRKAYRSQQVTKPPYYLTRHRR